MTQTTSQSAPKLPSHPEPHSMTWSRLELETIADYGVRCFEAGRAELASQQEVAAPVGTEKLAYVIAWLEGGCDPLQAAKELRSIVTPPVGAGGAGVMDARPDSVHSDSGASCRVQGPRPTDAERYQWLREKSIDQWEHPIVVTQERLERGMRYVGPVIGKALDAAIDAAILAKGGDQGEGK